MKRLKHLSASHIYPSLARLFQVFERIRNERPGAAAKVVAIPGDLCAEGLGISPQNVALLQKEVSIVFHSAATLKLEAPLKDAIIQNTAGTAKMIELAKGMKKLDVSTPETNFEAYKGIS